MGKKSVFDFSWLRTLRWAWLSFHCCRFAFYPTWECDRFLEVLLCTVENHYFSICLCDLTKTIKQFVWKTLTLKFWMLMLFYLQMFIKTKKMKCQFGGHTCLIIHLGHVSLLLPFFSYFVVKELVCSILGGPRTELIFCWEEKFLGRGRRISIWFLHDSRFTLGIEFESYMFHVCLSYGWVLATRMQDFYNLCYLQMILS